MDACSEYSSGCESGWTTYFDQLSCFTVSDCITTCEAESEYHEDEDPSMVSDASSGPHNLHEQDNEACSFKRMAFVAEGKKEARSKGGGRRLFSEKQGISCLDDTATSPMIRLSEAESTTKQHNGLSKSTKGKPGKEEEMRRQEGGVSSSFFS